PTVAQAARMVGVSPRSVHQFRKTKKEAPEKIKDVRAGELAPSKAVSELGAKATSGKDQLKKAPPFEYRVCKKWVQFISRYDSQERKQAIMEVIKWVLSKSVGTKMVVPVGVTYPDGSTRKIEDLIYRPYEKAVSDERSPLETVV